MKLRNLQQENPDHSGDWQAVKYESIGNRDPSPESLAAFTQNWRSGKATLSDWLRHRRVDIDKLEEGLGNSQKQVVKKRREQLYSWWLEYKVRYGFLKELPDVITYAPCSIKSFAEQKLKDIDRYLAGEMTGFAPFMFTNSLGLASKKDYALLMKQAGDVHGSSYRIYYPDDLHIGAALNYYHQYLSLLAEEGVDTSLPDSQPEHADEYTFSYYWPHIVTLSRNLVVKYTSKYSRYEDQAYVSYLVNNVSGFTGGYSLKAQLTQFFDAGFNNLIPAISQLDRAEQLDILNGLKDETSEFTGVVAKGAYTETGDELHDGQRYEFIYFPRVTFQGDSDIRLATNERSRLYFAKSMVEYPEAWLEGIAYMERKLEHAINNLHLLNAVPVRPAYDIKKLFQSIYIIETAAGMIQGTAFYLQGTGLITCYHCVGDQSTGQVADDLVVYQAKDHGKKYPVAVVKANAVIDLAIVRLTGEDQLSGDGLIKGDSDAIAYLDSIAVAGFPNYNFGDTGYFHNGQVTGFRSISGITHVLVSNNLVEGNSGGPAFNEEGQVIGVVVTGSESFQKARQTEKHGIIPINVLQWLG